MILVDFGGLEVSTVFSHLKLNNNVFDEKIYRKMIIGTIIDYVKQFQSKFGNLVFCVDSNADSYWRKDEFPYYKVARKKQRLQQQKKIDVDWSKVYSTIGEIHQELNDVFGYVVLKIDKLEADDSIGILTQAYYSKEPIIIISRDRDFYQLLQYPNVELYDPFTHKKVTMDVHPLIYLHEHVIRGDAGDNIPNILSDDDTYVTEGKRSKPIKKKSLEEWKHQNILGFAETPEILENYKRNRKLIDLSQIPEVYWKIILEQYVNFEPQAGNVYKYFVDHRMIEFIGELYLFNTNKEPKDNIVCQKLIT